jgi:hypothetical protein
MSAMYRSTYYLYGRADMPDGTYSFVLGVLGTNNKVKEYIVLENIVTKSITHTIEFIIS